MLTVTVRGALLLLTLLDVGCGDHDRSDAGGGPSPGTFVGTATDGSRVRLEIDSVDALAFACDGNMVRITFDPPGHVPAGGGFAVRFTVGGRMLRVRGTFLGDDDVAGAIADERHHCDLQFRVRRVPEPTATPSPRDPATHVRVTIAALAPVSTPSSQPTANLS